MKLLFASDLHGCLDACQQVLNKFHAHQANYLIQLGDVLNHGPRNPIPKHYNPTEVAAKLNQIATQIIAVRGNCDSEVDQALLTFPMMADYNHLLLGHRRLFLTHGHRYRPDNLPPLSQQDIFCSGHVHLPIATQGEHCILFNPGSTTLPREGHPPSYGIITEKSIEIYNLNNDDLIKQLPLK